MSVPNNSKVIQWCQQLKAGDENAASLLWQAFFNRLVELASKRISGTSKSIADEEDIALPSPNPKFLGFFFQPHWENTEIQGKAPAKPIRFKIWLSGLG